jgi:phytanoyl-CoA hydroxylase
VTVPVRAGGVTFHHDRTVHMAGANRTEDTRVSLATVYMDAGATFAPGAMASYLQGDSTGLGPGVMQDMQPGQPMDGERFPRVGRG